MYKSGVDAVTGCNSIEQFVSLAKDADDAAAADVIKQATEIDGVYGFGELLVLPNIKELGTGPYSNYYQLLELFAFGTYKDYIGNRQNFPELSPNQIKKLRHLTIVSLAAEKKFIPYSLLLQETDLKNIRDLEDLIIEASYAEIIKGKLDQKNSWLEVSFCIARDLKLGSNELSEVKDLLVKWNAKCETALSAMTDLVTLCNIEKTKEDNKKVELEKKIEEVKNQIVAAAMQEEEMVDVLERKKPQGSRYRMKSGRSWLKHPVVL